MPVFRIPLNEPVPHNYQPLYMFFAPENKHVAFLTVEPPNLLVQGSRGGELDATQESFCLDWVHETVEEIRSELKWRAGILDFDPNKNQSMTVGEVKKYFKAKKIKGKTDGNLPYDPTKLKQMNPKPPKSNDGEQYED